MACNYILSNLDTCGPITTGSSPNYIKNGGSVHAAFNFEANHVYMPYVELKIEGDLYITGDSQSSSTTIETPFCDTPFFNISESVNIGTNKTYIQSFEMTVGKSFEGTIVIITCDYNRILKLLATTPKETCDWDGYVLGDSKSARSGNGTVIGHIDIGWLIKDCNGNVKKFTMKEISNNFATTYYTEDDEEKVSGPYIYAIFKKVDVSFENGVYKATMTFVDGFSFHEETKLDKIWGDETMRITFKDALKLAAKFNCNTRKPDMDQQVARFSVTTNGKWQFAEKDGGKNGPSSVYNSWRQSLFPFLREVSNYLLTKDKKGWWFGYDNGSCGVPTFLLVEDRNPQICLNDTTGINANIAYVVNGGDCSPVIKFSPSFNAVPVENEGNADSSSNPNAKGVKTDISIGGGGPSGLDQTPLQLFSCNGVYNPNTGQTNATSTLQKNNAANGLLATVSSIAEQIIFRSPINVIKETAIAIYNQSITEAGDGNAPHLFAPIKATLEIHGDPYWANSLNLFKDCFIKIVFLNPFCIESNKNNECEWLQKPKCNDKFSGIYKVQSARHSINAGSYVTSLELFSIAVDNTYSLT